MSRRTITLALLGMMGIVCGLVVLLALDRDADISLLGTVAVINGLATLIIGLVPPDQNQD